MNKPLTEPVSLRFPPDLTTRLDRAAEQFMQTRSSLVRMILAGWLHHVDHPAAREALGKLPTEENSAT